MALSPYGVGLSRQHTAREACAVLPRQPGVYRFRDVEGRVLYVGRATDLRSRTRSYWGDLAGRRHLRRMVLQISRIEAVACASVHEAAWLERNLLERSRPRWNRAVGGAEVPRWLVVDTSPERPGIRLTHEPEPGRPTFGPYLGGERSRTALRGILRVWPLHLTSTRSSGTERAIAAARGVGAADQERLLADVVQLLGRDSVALERVTTALLAARDEAVARLMFETARQVHEELGAVTWLVSPQRVTASHPPGLVVCGWSAGMLVSFSGTAARLDRWDCRRVGERRGQELADLTPLEWREFAVSNAILAAELADAQGA
jgi:excinuclease ABC subunit C